MEEMTSRPVSLPLANPTQSYWHSIHSSVPPSLTQNKPLPSKTDILIIGSGISGSSIAYNLLSHHHHQSSTTSTPTPIPKITLLEARTAVGGATGRNGGHTKHASYRKFLTDITTAGLNDAIKIARLEYDCMVAVHDFIKSEGISCDAIRCPTVDVYYDADQFIEGKLAIDRMKQEIRGEKRDELVTDYEFHDAGETATRFLCDGAVGSITYEAGSLNAYAFTLGILERAVALGLDLHTNTPALTMRRLHHHDDDDDDINNNDDNEEEEEEESAEYLWSITTPHGKIHTKQLILATNGYTPSIYPRLQGSIIPFRGIITSQRPGDKLPQAGSLAHTYSFSYKSGFDYMITRPVGSRCAGDVVIGGGLTKTASGGMGEYGNTNDEEVDGDIKDYLTESTRGFFGRNWGADHVDGRVRQCWSGIMGYSADGYPLVGEVPGEKGLWIDASFQGHGMVLCFLCAKAVSEMILGRDGEELDRWFPRCFRVVEKRVGMKFAGFDVVPDVGGEGVGGGEDGVDEREG